MLLEFILFGILGWCVFAPPANRMVLMVIFIVLMVLWVIAGATGYVGHLNFPVLK